MTWFFEKDLCSAIDKVQCQLTTSPPRILAHWVPHYSEHEPDHKWSPHGHDLSLAISLNHKKIENLYLEIGFTISWLRLGIIFWVHYISYPDLVLPFFGYNSNTLPRSSFSWLSYGPTRIRRCSPIGQALYKIKEFPGWVECISKHLYQIHWNPYCSTGTQWSFFLSSTIPMKGKCSTI